MRYAFHEIRTSRPSSTTNRFIAGWYHPARLPQHQIRITVPGYDEESTAALAVVICSTALIFGVLPPAFHLLGSAS